MTKRKSSSSKIRSAKSKTQKSRPARKAAPTRKAKTQKKPAKRVATKTVAKKQAPQEPAAAPQPENVSPAAQRREETFAPPVHEHTKPGDVRGVIRASQGRHWTARQGGRG